MTIDERIGALTQSVELLASMHMDMEKKWDERMSKWDERMAKWDERMGKWDERMGKMLDIQEKLTTIVVAHEDRLNGHDKRLDELGR